MTLDKLTKTMKGLGMKHDRRKRWRNINETRYQKWKKARTICKFCGSVFSNGNKSTHRKSRKCQVARGLCVKPRKVRSDRGSKSCNM